MIDTKQLEQIIEASGYKKGFLAARIGVTSPTFSRCLKGRSEFKASQLQTLSEILKLTPEQFNSIFLV